MSASDKKRLRREQNAAILSEKQRKEQQEAKKLKILTIAFVSVILAVVVVTLGVLGFRLYEQSGIAEKTTIAAVVGDKELNTVELSYYYQAAIGKFYNELYEEYENYTDSYLQAMGLDTSKPLDEQVQDPETGKTWSTFFLEAAVEQAKIDEVLCSLAEAEGFTLPEDEQTTLDSEKNNLQLYAQLNGFNDTKRYLNAMYGYGADMDSYMEYSTRSALAQAYYTAHEESLTYDDAALREHEADKKDDYNSYNYSYAYLSYNDFILGGTPSEDGKTTTYSDEEKDAARVALKAAAEEMATATSLDELNTKAKEANVNETSELAVNDFRNARHTEIDGTLAAWLADPARVHGDIAAIPNALNTEEGTEVADVNGYYVIYFDEKFDNNDPMANVRHLLVQFTGGTQDEETGETVYTDEEKSATKAEADGYLKTWQEGEATEETFIALVKEHSDDGSASEGGLFEDINRDSQYVENFLHWSIDPERKAGDAEVIETEFGYHVMYYVGDDEMTYRDYMITNELRATDQETWYEEIQKDITTSIGDTSKMNLGIVLAG